MKTEKELCLLYIDIIKNHPLVDTDKLQSMIAGNPLDFTKMNELSKYYDTLDAKDERNSGQQIIDKWQIDKMATDQSWYEIEKQGLSNFLKNTCN